MAAVTMNPAHLLTTFDGLGHPRVLVLGDLILDRYTWGNAERVSQEAPVLLLRADRREARLGGAANVCAMLRGLEAEVTCAGVVGSDASGDELRQLLRQAGVDDTCLLTDPSRPTTVKERFIGRAQGRHPHQILRVDSEVRDPLDDLLENQLLSTIQGRLGDFDVVLVSDYDKGVCTRRLLREIIAAAREAGLPVLVDPIRSADYSRYRGATTMTPNRLEAEVSTGVKIVKAEDAFAAARKLRDDLGLAFAIVTLDRDGMALVGDGHEEVFPTRPRAVYDITGAGDMVLAMIGLCLADGVPPPDAIRLGNVAGGLEVEKVGVTVIPRSEIRERLLADLHQATFRQTSTKRTPALELARLVESHRSTGQRIAFTNGCFDLLDIDHVSFLQEAATMADVLIVGINSDESACQLLGSSPVVSQDARAAMLAALACVDYVVTFEEETPLALIEHLRPDVLVKGGTYTIDEVVGHELVEAYGGRVCVTGLRDGASTTGVLDSANVRQPRPKAA